MNLEAKQMLTMSATRISIGGHARRRRLLTGVPAAADYVLEPRLMLSATSDDSIIDATITGGGGTTLSGGDTSTGGTGINEFATGEVAIASIIIPPPIINPPPITIGPLPMPNRLPQLTVTIPPIPDTVVNGAVVGNASAIDLDGDMITFSFDGGSLTDPTGTFAIDPNTGVITVANYLNIGSQDGTYASPQGWSFIATIVASDGITSVGVANDNDASESVSFMVDRTQFKIISPRVDPKVELNLLDKLKFEGTRADGVKVKAKIWMKNSAGSWEEIKIAGAKAEKIFEGKGTTAKWEVQAQKVGDYKLTYEFWDRADKEWQHADKWEVEFKVK